MPRLPSNQVLKSLTFVRGVSSRKSGVAGDQMKEKRLLDDDSNIRITTPDPLCKCPHLKLLQEETLKVQNWNHNYWKLHNETFVKEKQLFLNSRKNSSNKTEKSTADELSVFYKDFLNRNYDQHIKYNSEWYQKNFSLLWLSFKCNLKSFMSKDGK